MASPRNSRSFMSAFQGFDTTLRQLFIDAPKAYVAQVRYKLKHLPKTNYELGVTFADQGKWQDAAFRFKVALYLQPNYPQAHYNLACCQLKLGQRAKARQSLLQTLRQVPDHGDALFMLSALDPAAVPPNQRPHRLPAEMVRQFFSSIAAGYDAIEAQNEYAGAKLVWEALKPLVGERTGLTIVDMGCGTGLVTRPWRSLAKEIVGVDFTPAMANAARLVKVGDVALFDRLLEEDILATTPSAAPLESADIVMLVNVAQFLGDLEPLLVALAARMKQGALLALSIEPFSASAGYGVNIETGRFGHHPEYIKQVAAKAGLTISKEARVQLYPQFNAQLYVLGK